MARPTTSPGSTRKRTCAERRLSIAGWSLAVAAAIASANPALAAGPKLLPADQAFRLSARALDAATIEIRYNVADGYYLYRDKLGFAVEPGAVGTGKPVLPEGLPHQDEFFGKVTTYRGLAVIRLPLAAGRPGQSVTLVADSQGCADAGVCYPPQRQKVTLTLPQAGAPSGPPIEPGGARKSYFN